MKWYTYGLILLFIFHFVNNYIIINSNEIPLNCDSFHRYRQSVELFRGISNIKNKSAFSNLIHNFGDPNRPPLYFFVTLPLYAFFGVSREVACMTNIFFLPILIWSIFLIGREFSNEYGGLLAAFILTTYPNVFGMSRWYMTDFASLAMVSLSIFFLIRSNNFLSRKYSILFGLTSAGAVLTRLASIYFLMGPVVFCIFRLQPWRMQKAKRLFFKVRVSIFNLALSSFVFLALFLPWLCLTNAQKLKLCNTWGNLIPTLDRIPGGLKWHFTYSFLNVQLHWFYAFIFFFSVIILIWKRPKELAFLLLWYIAPLFIMSALTPPGNCENFTLPGLGGVALVTALGIFSISWSRIKILFATFVCFLGLIQYFFISYSPLAGDIYSEMRIHRNIKELVQTGDEINMSHVGLLQAKKCNWEIDRIISIIMKDNAGCLSKKVLIIYSSWSLLGSLHEHIFNHWLPITLYWSWSWDWRGPPWGLVHLNRRNYNVEDIKNYNMQDLEKITSVVRQSDYILTYDSRFIPEDPAPRLPDKMFETFEKNKDNFEKIEELSMPDGWVLHIYKNNK